MFLTNCIVCGKEANAGNLVSVQADDDHVGYAHPACMARLREAPHPDGIVGFDRAEDGSAHRYARRRADRPWASHSFWWLVHNAVAHPLIAFVPRKPCFDFHDWTSRKMHGASWSRGA